jgi:hypothetical protein
LVSKAAQRIVDAQIVEGLVQKYTCLDRPEQLQNWLQEVINNDYKDPANKSERRTKHFQGASISYLSKLEVFNILTSNPTNNEYSITLRPFLYLYFSSNTIQDLRVRFLLTETDFRFLAQDVTRTILHILQPPQQIPNAYKP